MQHSLKKAIIDYIFENIQEFQLENTTINKFRAYIYNKEGGYLIGGKDVAEFIKLQVALIKDK